MRSGVSRQKQQALVHGAAQVLQGLPRHCCRLRPGSDAQPHGHLAQELLARRRVLAPEDSGELSNGEPSLTSSPAAGALLAATAQQGPGSDGQLGSSVDQQPQRHSFMPQSPFTDERAQQQLPPAIQVGSSSSGMLDGSTAFGKAARLGLQQPIDCTLWVLRLCLSLP